MDNGVAYGLRNPAFTDDIGMTFINRLYPITVDEITGAPINPQNPKINPGQPENDTFDNKNNEKKTPTWKKILLGSAIIAGIATAGFLAYKKIPAFKTKVTNLISKIKTKFNSP